MTTKTPWQLSLAQLDTTVPHVQYSTCAYEPCSKKFPSSHGGPHQKLYCSLRCQRNQRYFREHHRHSI